MTREQWDTLSRIILGIHRHAFVTMESYQEFRTFLIDNDLAPDWVRRFEPGVSFQCQLRRYKFDIVKGLLLEFCFELDPGIGGSGRAILGVDGRTDGQTFELVEYAMRDMR